MFPVSPGVYWREVDLSQYVPALATTTAGFVITATKGPVNERRYISTQEEFIEVFGPPHPDHIGTYACLQYLRDGNSLWVVRVESSSNPAQIATGVITDMGGSPVFNVESPDPGSFYNNVSVEVERESPKVVADAVVAEDLAPVDLGPERMGTADGVEDTFTYTVSAGHCLPGSVTVTAGTATLTDDGAGNLTGDGSGTVDYATGTVTATFTVPPTSGNDPYVSYQANPTTASLTFPQTPIVPGSIVIEVTLNGSTVQVKDDGAGNLSDDAHLVSGTVDYDDGTGTISTTYPNYFDAHTDVWADFSYYMHYALYVWYKNPAKNKEIVLEGFHGLVNDPDNDDYYAPKVINRQSKYIRITHTGNPHFPANGRYTLSGGSDGLVGITASDYVGVEIGNVKTGLQLFKNSEELDLNLVACPGITYPAVTFELISIVHQRRDCMCLPDPPQALSKENVVDWINGMGLWDPYPALNTSYAAVYWPWVKILDPYNPLPDGRDRHVWIPPSGCAAGIYARNDLLAEVWYAPAGVNRAIIYNAIGVEYNPSQGDRDFLYPNRINPIVDFPKEGIMIYGERTTQAQPSALDRVNVRRLLLFIEKAIATAVRPLVFEPNTPTLWRRFHMIVDPFLRMLKAREALYDYKIVCDETTNTPDVIDRNEMRATIMLKPVKTAEAIVLTFALLPTGANFDEYVGVI